MLVKVIARRIRLSPQHPTIMIRSILSVVVGYLTMAILVGVTTAVVAKLMLPAAAAGQLPQPTMPYMVINLVYSALFAAAGGFVCSLIAIRSPLAHALVLAALVALLGLVFFFQNYSASAQPRWYSLSILVLCPLGVMAGGYLRSLQAGP